MLELTEEEHEAEEVDPSLYEFEDIDLNLWP